MTETAVRTQPTTPTGGPRAIRPFQVSIPEQEVAELRRRVATTRWPTRELVKDRSQGVQLAMLEELARYWATDYDWRKAEARLNAYPQFVTRIDGVEADLGAKSAVSANGRPAPERIAGSQAAADALRLQLCRPGAAPLCT